MHARTLLLPLLLLAGAAPLAAQGILVPGCRDCRPGPPRPLPRALPVESVTLDTRIEGQVATTHVTQVFRNETGMVLEGTYFFPIPSGASVVSFAIWDGDRRLEGEVRSREEARRIYDAIVRRQRDPGLLEYAGENLLQASVFPIPARGTKKLELTYTQVLRADAGTVAYRYPLGVGRNASPVERFSGRVEVVGGERLGAVYSPTHGIDVRRGDAMRRCDPGARCAYRGSVPGGQARVTFETRRGEERRDFQLFYTPARGEVGLTLLTHREPGKEGYFLLLLSPDDPRTRREYPARDVVYVLDTSGSMNDEGKIDKARRALVFGLRGLGPRDRFNVVAFAGEARLMETGLVAADGAGVRRGVEFVEGLRATGGTNIDEALTTALRQLDARGDRPRQIVFLTDGLPTVGETDPDRILANAVRARRAPVRLFSFGVGYDVNTRLLDRMAGENGGTAEYVEPQEDLEVKVSSFFDKVNHPVLTDLRLDLGDVRTDRTYPRNLPDLFRGSQLALVGRYTNERDLRDVTLRLSGRASPAREVMAYSGLRFPLREDRNEFLPRLWATRRVGWLMEEIRTRGESRELRDEVVELGTRYGIVTPYTSYLALEPGARVDAAGGGRPRPVPTRPRPTVSAGAAPAAATAVTGRDAVRESRTARARQETLALESLEVVGTGQETVRRAGERAFYLRSGVWTDALVKPETALPVTEVTVGSDAYFDLVRRIPELGRYFALGDRVEVVHEGRLYRTRPADTP